MLLELAGFAVLHTLFLLLYVTNNSSFPKPLSKEEERRCLLLAAEGDQAAKNVLIEHNLRLVAHIIKKYYSTSRDQEDLLSIGTIGLIKAINSFDVQKGAKLATYASRRKRALPTSRSTRRSTAIRTASPSLCSMCSAVTTPSSTMWRSSSRSRSSILILIPSSPTGNGVSSSCATV